MMLLLEGAYSLSSKFLRNLRCRSMRLRNCSCSVGINILLYLIKSSIGYLNVFSYIFSSLLLGLITLFGSLHCICIVAMVPRCVVIMRPKAICRGSVSAANVSNLSSLLENMSSWFRYILSTASIFCGLRLEAKKRLFEIGKLTIDLPLTSSV